MPLSATAALSIASGIGSDGGGDYTFGQASDGELTSKGLNTKAAGVVQSASLRQEFESVRKEMSSSVTLEQVCRWYLVGCSVRVMDGRS
jgi:hypothetical protein